MLEKISEPNAKQKQFSTHIFNVSPHLPLHFDSPEASWPFKIISFYPKGHAVKLKCVSAPIKLSSIL